MESVPSASPPKSPRDERRDRHEQVSRGQLLDAAEVVFGHKGFHETTLKEVAERAEFSVGSVYSFFESKDDLFRQVFVRRGSQFLDEMRRALSDGGEDEQLHRLVDMQTGFFRRHPDFGRLVLRYFTLTSLGADGPLADAVTANFDEAMTLQTDLFTRGQRAGRLCSGDAGTLSRLLSGLVLSYQSVDPVVIGERTGDAPSLDQLQRVVDRAFVAHRTTS
jgi:TetR/AcrR family transcriptional regulator